MHHPGNIVPCCADCNKRKRDEEGNYYNWDEQLLNICPNITEYRARKLTIQNHIENEDYPNLTDDEISSLRAVASHLYNSTKTELDKSLELYKEIDSSLVRRRSH